MIVNKKDINECLLLIPNSIYNVLLLNLLKVRTDLYDNNKELKELQDKIKEYLGIRISPTGVLEPRTELDKAACEYTKQLIEVYNAMV